jgi:hypothetical protein
MTTSHYVKGTSLLQSQKLLVLSKGSRWNCKIKDWRNYKHLILMSLNLWVFLIGKTSLISSQAFMLNVGSNYSQPTKNHRCHINSTVFMCCLVAKFQSQSFLLREWLQINWFSLESMRSNKEVNRSRVPWNFMFPFIKKIKRLLRVVSFYLMNLDSLMQSWLLISKKWTLKVSNMLLKK